MIQRIQSVYLLLTTILAVLFLSGTIINFENGTSIDFLGTGEGKTLSDSSFSVLSILLAAIPLLSFITIFLYSNRKLQIRLIILLLFLILIATGILSWIAYGIITNDQTAAVFTYKLILPLLMLILCFLALSGVRKDERIVRSYDRLR